MAITDRGPDPSEPDHLVTRGYADGRYRKAADALPLATPAAAGTVKLGGFWDENTIPPELEPFMAYARLGGVTGLDVGIYYVAILVKVFAEWSDQVFTDTTGDGTAWKVKRAALDAPTTASLAKADTSAQAYQTQNITLFVGTQTQYNAVPAAERNAVGFVGYITSL